MTTAKKRGRPPKPKSERAVSVNFTMRLRPKLMEELRQSAEASDRTVSAEAERRLSQADVGEVARVVGAALSSVERTWGARWDANDEMRERCRVAADAALNLLLGPAPSFDDLIKRAKDDVHHRNQVDAGGSGILSMLLAPSPDDLARSFDRIQGLLNAQRAGAKAAGDDTP